MFPIIPLFSLPIRKYQLFNYIYYRELNASLLTHTDL